MWSLSGCVHVGHIEDITRWREDILDVVSSSFTDVTIGIRHCVDVFVACSRPVRRQRGRSKKRASDKIPLVSRPLFQSSPLTERLEQTIVFVED